MNFFQEMRACEQKNRERIRNCFISEKVLSKNDGKGLRRQQSDDRVYPTYYSSKEPDNAYYHMYYGKDFTISSPINGD
jgi:hypothetical protein